MSKQRRIDELTREIDALEARLVPLRYERANLRRSVTKTGKPLSSEHVAKLRKPHGAKARKQQPSKSGRPRSATGDESSPANRKSPSRQVLREPASVKPAGCIGNVAAVGPLAPARKRIEDLLRDEVGERAPGRRDEELAAKPRVVRGGRY